MDEERLLHLVKTETYSSEPVILERLAILLLVRDLPDDDSFQNDAAYLKPPYSFLASNSHAIPYSRLELQAAIGAIGSQNGIPCI